MMTRTFSEINTFAAENPTMTSFRLWTALALFLCCASFGQDASGAGVSVPGRKLETAAPVSPEAWSKIEGGGGFMLLGGPNTNEVQITPEIQSLARALDNDPRQIYEYVVNNVDYLPLWGSRNGATSTLLAKRGDDLDQSSLLISLLKAANPASDARYVKGLVVYSTSFLGQLLGINGDQVLSHLGECHVPCASYGSDSIQVYHWWVTTTINGTNFVLDTTFKEYDSTNALDILSIAGYTRTQFLARAVSGATVTTNSIRNANESNIRADLAAYSTNLLGYIRANFPNTEKSAVLGGRKIRQQTVATLPTSLPYAAQIFSTTEYTTPPSNYFWNITIQHQGINKTLRVYECAGKRVSVFYTGAGNAPQLRVDGTLIATGSATTTGQVYSMTVSLTRPNAGTVSNVFNLTSGKSYVIANDFGAACPALIANVSEQLARDRASGLSETSETVLGGSLHLMSLSYFNQLGMQQDMVSRMARVLATEHYDIGLMAQEAGYYIDIPMSAVSSKHYAGDAAKGMAISRSTSLLQSSLEHGMLEQMQGTNHPGASTVKLLKLSNSNNKETYFANSANWSGPSGVRTQLVNYSAQELAQLDSYISSGMTAILPKDAAITLAQWTGFGYIVYDSAQIGTLIKGNYKGGYSGYQETVQSGSVQNQTTTAYSPPPPANVVTPQSKEPVDLATGDYLFQNTDLALGANEPRGLKLVRYYNSAQSFRDSRLRYGWTHNYDIRAAVHSNPDLALGQRQASDAVSIALYSLIAADLLENELNIRGWVTASLATKWAMDQLIENAVNIQLGNKTLTFIKLADGSYSPPPSMTASLTGSNGAFRLNERFGVRYEFNANNLISAWRDGDTNTLSFSYNAQTNLSTVTDPYSRTLTFTYSGATQLSSVADSSSPGRSVSYGYSAGNLTSYTDPEGKVWSYSYDSNRWMRALTDPLAQVTASNTYDGTGMVVTQRNGKGVSWAFFTVPNWRGVEQDPFGARMTYYFDAEGRQASIADPLGNRRYFGYDGQGHVTNEIDARGFQTIYQYDANHNRTNTIDALGNATAFTYDSQYRLVSVRDALAHVTQYGYDSEHHLTNMVDALGNRTVTAFYANGLPQTVTGPRGEVTSYTYDSYGTPATIARTDGGTETRTWNARGDLLTLTDANTNTTTYTYDRRRLLTSERDPFSRAVSNIYDNAGLLVTNIDKRGFASVWTWTATYKERSVRYPDGGTVSNYFDLADRVILVRDPLNFMTSNRYDSAGRLVAMTDPLGNTISNTYDQSGNLVSVRDAAGNMISNEYDNLNRLAKTIDPLGYAVSNEYDAAGRLTARVDQEGKRTEFEYDAVGRVTLERRGALEFGFEYDASGNRTAFVNAKGARFGFGYDKMNRRVAETNALGQVTQLIYDPVGNLKQRVNGNGQTTYFYYNSLNLLTNRQSALESVLFSYDPNGNLTNLVDGLGTTRQTFDSMNRLTKVTDPFGQTVSNQYNLTGRRTQITYPDGKTEQFGYDGSRRLTNAVASAFGLSTVTNGYDTRNNLTSASLPGGLSAAYAYDAMNRMSSWSVSKAGSNLLQRSCTRDGMGFKATETIQAGLEALDGPALQTRQHNTADQIQSVAQADPSLTNVPAHDAAGNVTQIVVSARGQTFTTLYRYDYNSRLLSATCLRNGPQGDSVTTSVTQLEYDGLGLLSRITDNGVIRRLLRDRTDQLARPILETDGSGNVVRWFVWANGRLLAQVGTGSVIRVAHCDELGRVLAFTDGNGALTDEYAYQPYGRIVGHSGATDTPFTWLGTYGVWYAGNGLYLTRHRAYDANLSRFVQADPIGLLGGANLYLYAEANPVSLIDALGLQVASGPVIFVPTSSGLTMQNLGPVRSSWIPSGYDAGLAKDFWSAAEQAGEQVLKGQQAADATQNPLIGIGVTLGVYPSAAVEFKQTTVPAISSANAQALQRQDLLVQHGVQVTAALAQNPGANRVAINPAAHTATAIDEGPAFYPAGTQFITVGPAKKF